MTDIKVQIYFMCYVLHITVFFGGYLHFLCVLFISTRICAVEIIFWDHRHILYVKMKRYLKQHLGSLKNFIGTRCHACIFPYLRCKSLFPL